MNEDSTNTKYGSFKIPDRKPEQETGMATPSIKPAPLPVYSLSDGMFYEIEYGTGPIPGVGKFVMKQKPQKIEEPGYDPALEHFKRMREIAREHRSTYDHSRFFDRRVYNDNAVIFYQQAQFMSDFTDDYKVISPTGELTYGNTPFSQYFPCYQMMGYEQLRTYFTWRTRVRQGIVADTSLSYAFLYLYELLADIGVADPKDGLDKLMFFWRTFRDHNKSIDKYIYRWLKDYHIYYDLPYKFKEFVKKNDLADHYPELSGSNDDFELFCSISKYNIKKSAFFTQNIGSVDTKGMISACFSYVIDKIRQDFKAAGMDFDGVFFRPTRKLVEWKPFKDALFYDHGKHPDKQIVLSENEIYICKSGEWKFGTIITTEKGRQFIGYVMKQMESTLRKITKYRFKLTASIDMINKDTIRILSKAGLFIEKIVPAAVTEYYKEVTKTVVTVDYASLARIREEALTTQESLFVEEQTPQKITGPAPVRFSEQDQNIFADTAAEPDDEPAFVFDVWEGLKDILTVNELHTLAVVLQNGNIKAFADECGEMLEVLADGINEKAMDCIGDNLMDDDFVLYDDYIEKVKELIK